MAVPLLARVRLVCVFPLSAYDKVVHWDEARDQAASGLLPFPGLPLVLGILVEATPVRVGGAYAPVSEVARRPLASGPQAAPIQP